VGFEFVVLGRLMFFVPVAVGVGGVDELVLVGGVGEEEKVHLTLGGAGVVDGVLGLGAEVGGFKLVTLIEGFEDGGGVAERGVRETGGNELVDAVAERGGAVDDAGRGRRSGLSVGGGPVIRHGELAAP
jgi:hypothetical protein